MPRLSRLTMTEAELQELVDAWIAAEDAQAFTPDFENHSWAVSQVIDWALEGEAELLWRFILAAYTRDISAKVTGILAAGPLEDLLSQHGPDHIDQVEDLARRDERFNHLLGGVWRLSMTDEVWARVQSVRQEA